MFKQELRLPEFISLSVQRLRLCCIKSRIKNMITFILQKHSMAIVLALMAKKEHSNTRFPKLINWVRLS